MNVIKKLPEVISSIALIFFILYGVFSKAEINKLAVGIIIIGTLFYCVGLVVKAFMFSAIAQEQNDSTDDAQKDNLTAKLDGNAELQKKNEEDGEFEPLNVENIKNPNNQDNP